MLADNELAMSDVEAVTLALRQPSLQASWAMYHQIGDVLRSDDMAIAFSAGFNARMIARLDAEPTYLAPVAEQAAMPGLNSAKRSVGWSGRRLMVPGLAAAAAAAFFVMPQWFGSTGTHAFSVTSQVATNRQPELQNVSAPLALNAPAGETVGRPSSTQTISPTSTSGDATVVVLRDPRIDEYLLAHQRFSPSMYSSAQFARSATFASDANK